MKSAAPRIRRWLPILSVLALMVLSATCAQAQFEWQIEGKYLSEYEVEEATTTASAGSTLKLSIPWYATTITCNKLGSAGGAVRPGGSSEATLNLTSCGLSGPPFVAETCKVIEPVQLSIEGSIKEAGGDIFALLAGVEAGATMGAVAFKEGTECPLPTSNAVKGSLASSVSREEVPLQPFAFGPTAEEALPGHGITFGGHAATFAGTMNVLLAGTVKGNWTALATKSTPEFRLDGSTFSELSIEGESLSVLPEPTTTLSLTDLGLELSCEEAGEGEANVYAGGTADMNAYFAGCSLTKSSFCTIYATVKDFESEKNPGYIFFNGEGAATYHNGRHYLVFEGTPLFTFFLGGWACTYPEEYLVDGSIAFAASTALEDLSVQPLEIVHGELAELLGTQLEHKGEPVGLSGGTASAELFSQEPWGFE